MVLGLCDGKISCGLHHCSFDNDDDVNRGRKQGKEEERGGEGGEDLRAG